MFYSTEIVKENLYNFWRVCGSSINKGVIAVGDMHTANILVKNSYKFCRGCGSDINEGVGAVKLMLGRGIPGILITYMFTLFS